MKRLLCLFLSFFVFPAFAVTSESYVDSVLGTIQDEIPAIDSNTVLTNTGTAGEIGAKQIYDSTQSFETQTDALVTAETFNTAVQNAIDNEFVCIEWLGEHVPGNCLLYQIRPTMPKQTLPSTYTQIEYLEGTGTQWINTDITPNPRTAIKARFQIIGDPPTTPADIGFLGAYESTSDKYYLYLFTRNTQLNITMFIYGYLSIAITDHNTHTIEVSRNGDYYQDGVLKGTNAYRASNNCTTPIGIFRIRRTSGSMNSIASRFYNVQIDNGTVRRNFIPVRRNADNVLGMYDTVTGNFFTNAGTGKFIAGPDIVSNLYLPSGD